MFKSVAIITPTIGSDHLKECLESVNKQTYNNVHHVVVVDGADHDNYNLTQLIEEYCDYTVLNDNVGSDGWYGHRIYAAWSYLVNADYVCFLDEDNWLQPNHVSEMVKWLETNELSWTHSLRNIHRKDGTFACQDNCESLGWWPTWVSGNTYPGNYHIDTSSFLVKKDVLVQVAGAWYGKWGQDRVFFNTLKQYFPAWSTTRNYSLNYRLDGNPGSVSEEFFIEGNKYNEAIYEGNFPWSNPTS